MKSDILNLINQKGLAPILIVLLLAIGALGGGYFAYHNSRSKPAVPSPEPIFCTQDARLCPDGSYVSRIPPKCEFAPCSIPSESTSSAETAKKMQSLVPFPSTKQTLISPQEVDEAKRLALANPKVKERLKAAGVAENELIITHLFTNTLYRDEACRCVALFFNTREAVLPIEPIVDLTTKEVRFK